MLLNFDILFLILFFLSFFSFFFSSICFFFIFFSCFFSSTHVHLLLYLSSLLFLTFCFSSSWSLEHISTSPSLFLSLSLTHTHTHTHTNFSPSISHKQILSHTHIDHQQRTKIRESWPFKSVFMHAAWFTPLPLSLLPTFKNMQLNHHIGQIGILHVFCWYIYFLVLV